MAFKTLERFYGIDEDKGEIYHKLIEQRVVILDAESWLTMQRNLVRSFSSGGETILFEEGKAFGSSVVAGAMNRFPDRADRARFLSDLASASGWGAFDYKIKGDKSVVIESENYALADTESKSTKPSCFFLKGVYQGLYDVILGPGAVVEETKCRSKGDRACRFEIRPPLPSDVAPDKSSQEGNSRPQKG